MEIQRLPVLRDNYVFLLVDRPSAAAAVVDPAVAEPVIAALEAQQLQLSVVLQTHHHHDHIGGTQSFSVVGLGLRFGLQLPTVLASPSKPTVCMQVMNGGCLNARFTS